MTAFKAELTDLYIMLLVMISYLSQTIVTNSSGIPVARDRPLLKAAKCDPGHTLTFSIVWPGSHFDFFNSMTRVTLWSFHMWWSAFSIRRKSIVWPPSHFDFFNSVTRVTLWLFCNAKSRFRGYGSYQTIKHVIPIRMLLPSHTYRPTAYDHHAYLLVLNLWNCWPLTGGLVCIITSYQSTLNNQNTSYGHLAHACSKAPLGQWFTAGVCFVDQATWQPRNPGFIWRQNAGLGGSWCTGSCAYDCTSPRRENRQPCPIHKANDTNVSVPAGAGAKWGRLILVYLLLA